MFYYNILYLFWTVDLNLFTPRPSVVHNDIKKPHDFSVIYDLLDKDFYKYFLLTFSTWFNILEFGVTRIVFF